MVLSSILSSFDNHQGKKSAKSVQIYLLTFRILRLIAHSIQLSYQKGDVYEAVSQQYHKYGVFVIMIRNLEEVLAYQ
jgi:hypothetical protein